MRIYEAEKSSGNAIQHAPKSTLLNNIATLRGGDDAPLPAGNLRPILAGEHKLNPLAAGKAETASESWLCREQEPRPSGLRPAKEFKS